MVKLYLRILFLIVSINIAIICGFTTKDFTNMDLPQPNKSITNENLNSAIRNSQRRVFGKEQNERIELLPGSQAKPSSSTIFLGVIDYRLDPLAMR